METLHERMLKTKKGRDKVVDSNKSSRRACMVVHSNICCMVHMFPQTRLNTTFQKFEDNGVTKI